jgi:hypothetical protein
MPPQGGRAKGVKKGEANFSLRFDRSILNSDHDKKAFRSHRSNHRQDLLRQRAQGNGGTQCAGLRKGESPFQSGEIHGGLRRE